MHGSEIPLQKRLKKAFISSRLFLSLWQQINSSHFLIINLGNVSASY